LAGTSSEINYGGSTEEIRRYVRFGAEALGTADKPEALPSSASLSLTSTADRADFKPRRPQPPHAAVSNRLHRRGVAALRRQVSATVGDWR
jgi:hypothetical protein